MWTIAWTILLGVLFLLVAYWIFSWGLTKLTKRERT
jgi:hypothetical protein